MAESHAPLPPRWTQQSWMIQGSCRGRTAVFFAPHAERPQARVRREAKARLICATCVVQSECRQYAREHREFGIWGGESEEDRARHGYSVPWPLRDRRRTFETGPFDPHPLGAAPSALG
jgi:WhiB family redox-sensing transcriptional regulator